MEHPQAHYPHEHTEHNGKAHPTPRTYVTIGVILAVLTALEVTAFEVLTGFDPALVVWIIILLTLGKLGFVVAYFMHLKFDDWRFAALFMFPFVIMVSIMVALLAIFGSLTRGGW